MEVGTSQATLVTSENPENVKIPLHRHSKISYLVAVGAIAIAVGFMVATALLVDQMARSQKLSQAVEKELEETQEKIKDLSKKENVCMTKQCITSAAQILEHLDESIDPCDDFYEYACGGWKKKNPIPGGHYGISQFSIVDGRVKQFVKETLNSKDTPADWNSLKKTRNIYKACMDEKSINKLGVAPFIDLMDPYGQWPLVSPNWTEKDFDWRKASASMLGTLNVGFLFEMGPFVDLKNTDKNVIYFDQIDLGIPDFVLEGPYAETLQFHYKIFIYRVVQEFRSALRPSNESAVDNTTSPNSDGSTQQPEFDLFSFLMETDDQLLQDIDDLINFQIALLNISTRGEERNWNETKMYNPMSVAQLQAWTNSVNATSQLSQINWYEYLNDVFSLGEVFISRREKVVVLEPKYFKRLVELLDQSSPRTVANLFFWRFLLKTMFNGPSSLLYAAKDFWTLFYGWGDREPWCRQQTEELIGFALGAEYVRKMFSVEAKRDVEDMTVKLIDAFTTLVEETSWMDEKTKENAILKATSMHVQVGYPDWMINHTVIEGLYEEINPRRDSHLINYFEAKSLLTKREFASLRVPVHRNGTWASLPNVVNAFYLPWLNLANLPAGIIQPPFYFPGGLAALNYGGIGSVIGHEVTHGFDNNGHKRDKDGIESPWWSNSTLAKYLERTKCMTEQYGNYSLPELSDTENIYMNGTTTLGENIADNGAVREAFRAYQTYIAVNGREPHLPGLERFTSEQLFFLSNAQIECSQSIPEALKWAILSDPHSSSRFRVIGSLSNSVEFIEHFKCPVNSRMNRLDKCVVW